MWPHGPHPNTWGFLQSLRKVWKSHPIFGGQRNQRVLKGKLPPYWLAHNLERNSLPETSENKWLFSVLLCIFWSPVNSVTVVGCRRQPINDSLIIGVSISPPPFLLETNKDMFFKRTNVNSQHVYQKIFNITNCQGNANQNYN
uniref:Uncharacterized protein n=1 Tax=Pipistrellus kuhlii TaxID=59472 RepID=A0A7J7RT15_PIPKU|nr:hypothetical protein mPipKuh1_010376 [Pipistrellus kuhlii]